MVFIWLAVGQMKAPVSEGSREHEKVHKLGILRVQVYTLALLSTSAGACTHSFNLQGLSYPMYKM